MPDAIVSEALEAHQLAESAENKNRKRAKEDIKFARIPGNQWPAKIRAQRQREGRPCLEIDTLGPVLRQVVNDARMNRPSTNVIPVDSKADKETADVLSGMIRSIEAFSGADIAYDTGVECAASGGFGYWRIAVDYSMNAVDEDGIQELGESIFDKSLFIRAVPNQFAVFGDPYSTSADGSDWMQAHVVESMSPAMFKRKYPGASNIEFDGMIWGAVEAPWRTGDEIQVAEFWKREEVVKKALALQTPDDVLIVMEEQFLREKALFEQQGFEIIGERPVKSFKVTQHIVNGVEELERTEWKGSYIPIVPVYGEEVNLEGERHLFGVFNRAKDAARNFNYWRSGSTEMVALAPRVPFVGEEGAFDVDPEKWATANSHSHAYLEYKKGSLRPERQMPPPIPAGMMQEALSASDDVKRITGIYEASLGARSNETSGVAIRERKMEGDISNFHFIDNLTRAIRHSGRILVDLVPKVYTNARVVRILGEDGTQDERRINQEYQGPDGTVLMHDVRTGRYDVVVKAGPSFTTRREEQSAQMMELIRSYPDAAPIVGDLLVKSLDWHNADEIADRLKKMLPPQLRDEDGGLPPEVQQQINEMAQAIQQLQGALSEAQNDKDIKTREVAVKEYQAVTARFKEMGMDPAMMQALLLGLSQDIGATEAMMPGVQQNFPPEGAAPLGQAA